MAADISPLKEGQNGVVNERLVRLVSRQFSGPGKIETDIPGLCLFRSDSNTTCQAGTYEPSLFFGIQGAKDVQLGDRNIRFEPFSYLFATVHLPVLVNHIDASPEHPYMGLKLTVQPEELTQLLMETSGSAPQCDRDMPCDKSCGLTQAVMGNDMQLALERLLGLLEKPDDIPVLAPMARREILYRALMGELGPHIRRFATIDPQEQRISQVIGILQDRFNEPMRVGDLAEQVNMSESSLYHSFKRVTRMSPLQYQKMLRLNEARRLMLTEGLEAASASYQVGYESPSQFSREYRRLFGAPPRTEIGRLRAQAHTQL
ncbi:AraC family transcriptional regulator [Marinihelvus fidelis]|uniref:AraC family transcriptional regulator n=1 Tax=Marinihelvus fidelis TaxID=2613842 RepID=A0A5N0TJP0_9GAMM|nr:AraC family transcriptional regulator [Marinihelvus fidelis]KAA9134136.1 AraC family transcriptional regulator [Marinihelvus fidelis]